MDGLEWIKLLGPLGAILYLVLVEGPRSRKETSALVASLIENFRKDVAKMIDDFTIAAEKMRTEFRAELDRERELHRMITEKLAGNISDNTMALSKNTAELHQLAAVTRANTEATETDKLPGAH